MYAPYYSNSGVAVWMRETMSAIAGCFTAPEPDMPPADDDIGFRYKPLDIFN